MSGYLYGCPMPEEPVFPRGTFPGWVTVIAPALQPATLAAEDWAVHPLPHTTRSLAATIVTLDRYLPDDATRMAAIRKLIDEVLK